MAYNITEATPLCTIYVQIEHSKTPAALLGISSDSTSSQARDAYLTFALKIHPDKAPSDRLRTLHTRLFQKVQAAYDTVLTERFADQSSDSEPSSAAEAPEQKQEQKQLPETHAALHARNLEVQEALRTQRDGALAAKRLEDARKAAKKIKDARIQADRQARREFWERLRAIRLKRPYPATREEMEQGEEKDDEACNKANDKASHGWFLAFLKTVFSAFFFAVGFCFFWLKEVYFLLVGGREEEAEKDNRPRPGLGKGKLFPRPQNKYSQSPPDHDQPVIPKEALADRWHQTVLHGGSGCVSAAEKERRSTNIAATALQELLPLDAAVLKYLPTVTLEGNTPFSGSAYVKAQDALRRKYVLMEQKAQARVNLGLKRLGRDVRAM